MKTLFIAGEYLRRSFTSRLLVLAGIVVFLYFLIVSCFYGGQFYVQGRVYAGAEQAALARAVAFHLACLWGIVFGIMLGAGAVAQPLTDGRTAFLLVKPCRRREVLAGQLLGAWATTAATVVGLLLIATVTHLIRANAFPGTLWLGAAGGLLAAAVAVTLAAFCSLFLPRVVTAMLALIAYGASWPAAFPELRDFMTGAYKFAELKFPWWLRWGSEVYFAAWPPLAGLEMRAADVVAGRPWGVDGWLTLATGAVYTVTLAVATWALFARRDV